MSDEPVIFISHSSMDKDLALVLQEQIAIVLGINTSDVFVSVDPYAIPAGSDWFETITKQLDVADALVVIVSSSSMVRILLSGTAISTLFVTKHSDRPGDHRHVRERFSEQVFFLDTCSLQISGYGIIH